MFDIILASYLIKQIRLSDWWYRLLFWSLINKLWRYSIAHCTAQMGSEFEWLRNIVFCWPSIRKTNKPSIRMIIWVFQTENFNRRWKIIAYRFSIESQFVSFIVLPSRRDGLQSDFSNTFAKTISNRSPSDLKVIEYFAVFLRNGKFGHDFIDSKKSSSLILSKSWPIFFISVENCSTKKRWSFFNRCTVYVFKKIKFIHQQPYGD